jgi:hypothetical protein
MIKALKILLTAGIVVGRIYLIFKVIEGLMISKQHPEYSLDNIQWYLYVLLLDLYIVKIMDNSDSEDIYSKKE